MTAPAHTRAEASADVPDFRSPAFLRSHAQRTLAFYARQEIDPSGGFHHFYKDDGTVYDRRTRHLVSSTRFVFNHAMAHRHFGGDEHLRRARHGLAFVHAAHAQPQGGFAWTLDWHEGRTRVTDGTQHAYGLAFVILAHAHALKAGLDEARAGLSAAVALMEARFWEPDAGLYADEASPDWQHLSPYRGQNANMHACEAMLAAFDATGEPRFKVRALALAQAVTQTLAARVDTGHVPTTGLVWEHYRREGAGWAADWDYNRGDKANLFRPWGFQTGHLTEWAKLLVQLHRVAPAPWQLPTAERFFAAAMAHGWDDAHGGLVYGFAPDGAVCDGDKYFWVQAESFAAAALLAVATGHDTYWHWYDSLWGYAWQHFVDHEHGAWFRILGPDNRKLSDEKSPAGKTDYHTMGACYDVLRALAARA